MPTARPIIWGIFEEHLDEAAFLFGQWERAMNAANYTLDEVIDGPEDRLLAHLDGLVLGGKRVADRFLIPALADEDPGKVWAAAWALVHAEDGDSLDLVVDALAKAEKREARAAIGRAFELSHRGDLRERLLPLLAAGAPEIQAVVVNVLSIRWAWLERGRPAPADFPLEAVLETRHPELLIAGLRALGRAPDPAYARFVARSLASPYVAIRDAAIETGMLLGMRDAWKICSKLVARNAMGTRLPLALLALGGEPVDLKAVIHRLEVDSMRRDALWALGFSGSAEAAEAVVGFVADEALGRLAGESLATITGLRVVGRFAQIGSTDNAAPTDADEDDEGPLPAIEPEEHLPAPNAAAVGAWWKQAKPGFDPDIRFAYGTPITTEVLQHAIAAGPTWRRRAWFLEVAMRGGGYVDAEGWARHQKEVVSRPLSPMRFDSSLPTLCKL